MSLLELYNDLSTEQQGSLGKASSKISGAGCHLVSVDSMMVIDDSRVKVEFKNAQGQTIDLVCFLTNKDPSKVEASVNRAMGILAQMCTAAGTEIKKVLSKSVNGTVEYKSGTVPTEEYPSIKGKKLYITTTTIVEGDNKDANKTWVKQEIDSYKFFDTKKRTGLEISSEADEGTTMDEADAEAKVTFNVSYKWANNKACQAKLAQLQGGSTVPNTSAGSTEEISSDDI